MKKNVLIVKLGSEDRPATPEDIKCVYKDLKKLRKKSKRFRKFNIIVTHHDIEFHFLKV